MSLVFPTCCVAPLGPGVSPRQEGLVETEVLALAPQNPGPLAPAVPSPSFLELESCFPSGPWASPSDMDIIGPISQHCVCAAGSGVCLGRGIH